MESPTECPRYGCPIDIDVLCAACDFFDGADNGQPSCRHGKESLEDIIDRHAREDELMRTENRAWCER